MSLYTAKRKMVEFAASPMMLATWPGPGNVGTMAIDFLCSALKAEPLAHLDMSDLYSPSSIPVREGKFMRPVMPEGDYYFKRNPALILFECDSQLAEKESLNLVHHIVQNAKEWGVSRIITVGGLPRFMDHTQRSDLRFASSDERLAKDLETAGFTPLPKAVIEGPMGIVPSVAAMLGLKAACILATMPVYASGIYYPKACLALLEGIERLLHMHFDHGELERVIEELETLYNQVEEKIREQFPTILTLAEPPYDSEEEVEERALAEATDLPQPVIIKIEKLFKEAANDRLKAVELKRVLDRHGIFKKYEDRFLDLFSEPEGDTEIR